MALLPGGALKAAPLRRQPVHARRRLRRSHPRGIVLWTRLAPDRRPDGEIPRPAKIPVGWRVARDDSMRHVVATGQGAGHAGARAFGPCRGRRPAPGRRLLLPVRQRRGGERGRPLPHRAAATTGWTSSASPSPLARTGPSGYYTAYRDMVQNDLDLVLHLGDYTYEYGFDSWNRGRARWRCRVQRGER